MDEKDEARMDEAVRELLKDPVMVKEVTKMRDRGMSETYVQNWLRQIAALNQTGKK